MNAISSTEAREKFATLIQQVCDDHEPVIITRYRKKPVVMISLENFSSLEETAYLKRSPANRRRLLRSMQRLGGTKKA